MLAFRDGIRVVDISNRWWLAAPQEFSPAPRGARDGPLTWRLAPEVTVGRLQGRHALRQPKTCCRAELAKRGQATLHLSTKPAGY